VCSGCSQHLEAQGATTLRKTGSSHHTNASQGNGLRHKSKARFADSEEATSGCEGLASNRLLLTHNLDSRLQPSTLRQHQNQHGQHLTNVPCSVRRSREARHQRPPHQSSRHLLGDEALSRPVAVLSRLRQSDDCLNRGHTHPPRLRKVRT
jgi:hypothetical protein